MPVYKYSCSCGLKDFAQYLNEDKSTKVMVCINCGKLNTAHQVRDKSASFKSKDGVTAIVRPSSGTTNQ